MTMLFSFSCWSHVQAFRFDNFCHYIEKNMLSGEELQMAATRQRGG
jgi:hypothetical protein